MIGMYPINRKITNFSLPANKHNKKSFTTTSATRHPKTVIYPTPISRATMAFSGERPLSRKSYY